MFTTHFMFIHCPHCGAYSDVFHDDERGVENRSQTICPQCDDIWSVKFEYVYSQFHTYWYVDNIEFLRTLDS